MTKSSTFRLRAQAQRWAQETEDAGAQGGSVGVIRPPKGITLSDVIEAFLESVVTGRTAVASLNATARAIVSKPVADFGAMHMQTYVARRRKEGASGATISGDLSHLSEPLRWARYVRSIA